MAPKQALSIPPDGISFVIYGEPASKANSRIFIRPGLIIKSKKALKYSEDFRIQCPKIPVLHEGYLCCEMKIWYSSRRPDLDESLILDLMQGLLYANDRQIRKKIIEWGLDPANPRCLITLTPLELPDEPAHEKGHRAGHNGSRLTRTKRKNGGDEMDDQ